jgi:phage terminase large subunit
LHGGRGSAKSYTIARALLIIGSQRRIRVLFGREFQNSMNESVIKLLEEQANEIGLGEFYDVSRDSITGLNGSYFMFKGVRNNVQSIKSMVGITHLWLEEADTVSRFSWDVLIPTIREENSEIWVSFNPQKDDDPTYEMFVKNPRPDMLVQKVSWRDNPWFPEELKKEKDYLFQVDPDLAMHVWEGECRSNSDAQVFKDKWVYEDFEIAENFDGPYIGCDWGFSQDPTALTVSWIDSENMELLIRKESYGIGIDIDYLPEKFRRIPETMNAVIRADNSRPETISYMSRQGFNIIGADKWKGCVEDGISFMRSFRKIRVHTDCPHTRDEFRNYSYKVDRLTGDVTTDILDKHNHCIDSIRYGIDPLISRGTMSILDVL